MNPQNPPSGALPYTDTKPQGAADFYFAINSTFRFIEKTLGTEGLVAYWQDLGTNYMKPVWTRWKTLGLEGIASYWRAFFDAEPGADVEVIPSADRVVLEVKTCPAIAHLRKGGRVVCPDFCRHCYYVSNAAAEKAGFTVRVEGGNGRCRQTFFPVGTDRNEQNLEAIHAC